MPPVQTGGIDMHQHSNIMVWELKEKEENNVKRYCAGCGKKVVFKDSGVRRHNANGKNLTQFAIYKCDKGHTWNLKLQDYKAKVADETSDPMSLEREGYTSYIPCELQKKQANKDEYDLTMKSCLEVPNQVLIIQIQGNGKPERLDKLISQNLKTLSRSQIQKGITLGHIKLNGINGEKINKVSSKVRSGDRIVMMKSWVEGLDNYAIIGMNKHQKEF